jgi:hypothetical protein
VDIHPHLTQCPAGLGSYGDAFQSLIYAFGCFIVMAFFYVFHRAQQS